MNDAGEIPILLNTSFNTKGTPLIQKTSDAIEMLHKTGLDKLIIDDMYISKE
jgi:predicted NodU family carbamoyl transferase